METSATAAAWFLPAVVPISLWVAWSDMKAMRIPNLAVYALLASFLVIGVFTMETADYLWRLPHVVVMLLVGMVLNALRLMGAGDAKFIAAAAPFVALGDWNILVFVYATAFLVCYALHRIAKHSPLRRLAPDWQSWSSGKRFPMGVALGATLIGSLVLALRPDWLAAILRLVMPSS